MSGELKLMVKWSGQEYEVDGINENDNVETLKDAIFRKTGVRPERQKLLNLKFKGKLVDNDVQLMSLNLKSGFKIMMMGSREEAIADANTVPDDLPPIVDDFDIPEEEEVTENQDVYLAKINRRVREYEINILNEPREGKKLLVLDIDYTLFDHRSVAENGFELMRPYLHEFLTSAYRDYDIAIWSATSMKWIEEKMKILGVSTHPDYKIVFYLDCLAMISVYTKKHGVVQVKPLGVVWGKFDRYSANNTIMFDDIRRNFLMNKQNGLRVRPFRQAHLNRDKDRELIKLAKYLRAIAKLDSFDQLNHKQWEKYLRKVTKDRRKSLKKNNNNNNNSEPDNSTGCDSSRPSTSS